MKRAETATYRWIWRWSYLHRFTVIGSDLDSLEVFQFHDNFIPSFHDGSNQRMLQTGLHIWLESAAIDTASVLGWGGQVVIEVAGKSARAILEATERSSFPYIAIQRIQLEGENTHLRRAVTRWTNKYQHTAQACHTSIELILAAVKAFGIHSTTEHIDDQRWAYLACKKSKNKVYFYYVHWKLANKFKM